jgi:ABC-type glycerol-3-phosphate transport system permease component
VSGTATARPVRSASQSARGAATPPERRRRIPFGRAAAFVLATAWLVVVIAPIYYMVLASFRSQGTYLTQNPWLPSGRLTVSEYGTVFGAGLGRYLLNSAILTAVCIVLTLTICLGAAFA